MKAKKIRVLSTSTDNRVLYNVDDLFSKLKQIAGSYYAEELDESRWRLYRSLYRKYYKQYTKETVTSFDVPNFIQFGITSIYLPRFTKGFLTTHLIGTGGLEDFLYDFFSHIELLNTHKEEEVMNSEFADKHLDIMLIKYKDFI